MQFRSRQLRTTHRFFSPTKAEPYTESHRIGNAKPMKESLAKTLYDLVREQVVP
jgi:hypothetical protein